MTAAEREALRRIRVSGVDRVTVAPDSVTTEFRSLAELERIAATDAVETSVTAGSIRVRRVAFGISNGLE